MRNLTFFILAAISFTFHSIDMMGTNKTFQEHPSQANSANPLQLFNRGLPMEFNLDKVRMNVIKTAENGVVNHETNFLFSQTRDVISAEYSGGKIRLGFLVGKFLTQNQLTFSYCQMQEDGTIDNGASVCEVSKNEIGKITLTEHFEWASRPGEFGTNIFQEI